MMETVIDWSGRSTAYSEEEIQIILDVARNADPQTQGKYLIDFENKIKDYFGVRNAFALTNATNALDLVALLSGISDNDEIIMPAHTFCASAYPFGRVGAKLVWADIDPDSRLIDPKSIKRLITSKTKAIQVVHLYGLPCEMDEIQDICLENELILIEDCAQSFGAEYKGKKTGTFGDFSVFSLHAQKNITTLGEGGILLLKNDKLAQKVPGLRHHGLCEFDIENREYWQPAMSNVDCQLDNAWPYNFSMTEIQAALGAKLIDRVDKLNQDRAERAQLFINSMKDFPELSFQKISKGLTHVYHLLSAKYDGSSSGKNNHDLISILFYTYKIKCIVQYYPLYRYPLFQKMGFGNAECPNTDDFFDNMISFPFHHWMTDEQFEYLIESTKKALKQLKNE
jgi:perosamine synthetase